MLSFGSHVATDKTNVVTCHIACLIQFQLQPNMRTEWDRIPQPPLQL